jgi:hypothetical protein
MLDTNNPLQISIAVSPGIDIDEADLQEMTITLQRELEDLPQVIRIEQASGAPAELPAHRKSGTALTLGALIMAVLPTLAPKVLEFLKDWTLRPGARPLKIKVQRGADSIEVEFDPLTSSSHDVTRITNELQTLLGKDCQMVTSLEQPRKPV